MHQLVMTSKRMSIVFSVLAALTVSCSGIFVFKLSEDAVGKMIAQTLENMDFELFNLTGRSLINSDYIKVENITANHLEGVVAYAKFMAGGKLKVTVTIRRMRCTVHVRGYLMKFINVNDKPAVEFLNSTLDLLVAMGSSGEKTISFVTLCDMKAAGAIVTSQHWAVNIAKLKVVPNLISGPHLKNKVCPHIEEKLLGNMLALIGVTGRKSIVMSGFNISLHVADRGVTKTHLYVVYQDDDKRIQKLLDWQRDLALQPMTQFKDVEIHINSSFIYDVIESSAIQYQYEAFLDKHLTLRRLEKYFKALRSLRSKITDYSGDWSSNMETLRLQTDRGMTTLPVQITLSLNITSECASYILLQFNIDIEIAISTVARTSDVLFYIGKWRERLDSITSQIDHVTDLHDLLSEFKLFEWFYPSANIIAKLGLSSLVPRKLALYNATATPNQNYLIIEADIDLEKSSRKAVYERHNIKPEYDVSNFNMTYYTTEPEMCTNIDHSNPDRTFIVQYVDENIADVEHNNTIDGAAQTSHGVVISLFLKLQWTTYFIFYFCIHFIV